MERRQLEYLVAVAQHEGFTSAAAACHVTQPAMSRAIHSLERELGAKLFRPHGRGIVVTDFGRTLADRARAILADMDEFVTMARRGEGFVGRVDVAVTSSPSIQPMTSIVTLLKRTHPDVTVAATSAETGSEVVAQVLDGRCEIGMLGQRSRPVAQGLTAVRIGAEEMMLFLPPGSELAGCERIKPEMLRGQSFVVAPTNTEMRSTFERFASEVGGLTVAVEASHREGILSMVHEGLGIAIMPGTWQAFAPAFGASVASLDPPIRIPLWLIHRPGIGVIAESFADAARVIGRN